MGLFTRMPQASPAVQYYTVGNNRTVLIVGLGNPGPEYNGTRHNIGFACVDNFVAKAELGNWQDKKEFKCQLANGTLGDSRVIVIKPNTFMNLSGEAVQAVARFYRIKSADIYVVHDELDIPFGQIRLRQGGGAAGHNGIKSLIEQIGPDFGRIRVGIGPKTPEQIDSADFVLQRFPEEQQAKMPALANEVISILHEIIFGGALPQDTRSFI